MQEIRLLSEDATTGGPRPVTQGPFAGWIEWPPGADPFEDLTGAYYFKPQEDGSVLAALAVERKHLNTHGAVHGGMIMAFVDCALFAAAHPILQNSRAVTITCNTEFVGAAHGGAMLEARAEVVRETGSLVFVQGRIAQAGEAIAAFSGTLKKIRAGS
jgi:uncharacterized protein (TIGR00369 family)